MASAQLSTGNGRFFQDFFSRNARNARNANSGRRSRAMPCFPRLPRIPRILSLLRKFAPHRSLARPAVFLPGNLAPCHVFRDFPPNAFRIMAELAKPLHVPQARFMPHQRRFMCRRHVSVFSSRRTAPSHGQLFRIVTAAIPMTTIIKSVKKPFFEFF